jgi:hypothetical protein
LGSKPDVGRCKLVDLSRRSSLLVSFLLLGRLVIGGVVAARRFAIVVSFSFFFFSEFLARSRRVDFIF